MPMPYFDSVSVQEEWRNVCHMQWHPPGKMTLNLLPAEPTDLCQGPIVNLMNTVLISWQLEIKGFFSPSQADKRNSAK